MKSIFISKKDWKKKFDTALPDLTDSKWRETLHTDFSRIKSFEELDAAGWSYSTHGLRKYEYWCNKMIEFSDEGLIIHSEEKEDHDCPVCGARKGIFTGGIETRRKGDNPAMLFEQAFGYFEATVIVPRGTGMWSAFWLQTDAVGQIGNRGRDGTEIDVYESSFIRKNPTKTGQALHFDAYNPPFYRVGDNVTETGKNLYDGQPHTYALKWSPEAYVMYLDGEAVWATNYGGVSRVPEYLRLTVEIRDTLYGPYAQKIGKFQNHADGTNDFIIKEVKVYQNDDYIPFIKKPEQYRDLKKAYTALLAATAVVGSAAATAAAVPIVKAVCRRIRK